eukprot:m.229302 g.229302  ORF g.229302 m.229302 type:complete len:557 (-) comp15986_c0_seq20:231-1901(-)
MGNWLAKVVAVAILALVGKCYSQENVVVYDTWEMRMQGPDEQSVSNPFTDVSLTALFSLESLTFNVSGFYDGNGEYVIRFMPNKEGTWSYKVHSNEGVLDGKKGSLIAKKSSQLPVSRGVARAGKGQAFYYDDGTPFYPLGTTCYAWVHQPEGDELENTTLESLRNSPFNKLRMTVFPKYYPFTHHEPRYYPYKGVYRPNNNCSWDFSRFNVEFFQHLEKRVKQVQDLDVIPELILFHPYDGGHWGFDRMSQNCPYGTGGSWCDNFYLRYVVARFSAFRNVWWSMANEWDIVRSKNVSDWDRLFKTLQDSDPYNKERSIHNCVQYYNHSQPWITHVSLQGHAVSQLNMTYSTWVADTPKPVVWDEVEYEGNITYGWGNMNGEQEAQRGWEAYTNRVFMAGHSNTDLPAIDTLNCSNPNNLTCNAIMWWNKGDILRGESPDRLHFLRSVMMDGPTYDDLSSSTLFYDPNPVYMISTKDKRFVLVYWANQTYSNGGSLNTTAQLQSVNLEISPDEEYTVDFIDYWNMNTKPLPAPKKGSDSFPFKPNTWNFILRLRAN